MEYITIASPDKISIRMCLNFLISNLGKNYKIGELHSLMSMDSINVYIDKFINKNPKGLFIYYAKRQINKDPNIVIPQNLLRMSGVVLWFNLYSTDYVLVKDRDGNFNNLFLDTWNKYIAKMNAIGGGV
jgi:hypothetical protein